ncbi:MAG: hypothetical protein IJT66_01725 [Clostridia bacterium]|nr:hypothetical protein [Clostridia bacterium]
MDDLVLQAEALPNAEAENESVPDEDHPSETAQQIFIPIKYNKEIRQLTPEEAGKLAQMGLKFEAISGEYEQLKRLAAENGQGVPAYLASLEKNRAESRKKQLTDLCGGNTEMAEYIMGLEKPETEEQDFQELTKEFSQFKTKEDVPEEVRERARLTGRPLLDEYLRYRHENARKARRADDERQHADFTSIGPQTDRGGTLDAAAAEFLKGLRQ